MLLCDNPLSMLLYFVFFLFSYSHFKIGRKYFSEAKSVNLLVSLLGKNLAPRSQILVFKLCRQLFSNLTQEKEVDHIIDVLIDNLGIIIIKLIFTLI